jgi:hypothetical protein
MNINMSMNCSLDGIAINCGAAFQAITAGITTLGSSATAIGKHSIRKRRGMRDARGRVILR